MIHQFYYFARLRIFNSFSDKQQKLKNLKNAQKQLEEKFHVKFENYIKLENLRSSILQYRSKNQILSALIKEKRENIIKLQDVKRENHDKNRAQRIILPKYEDKVNKLGYYVLEAVEKNENLHKKSIEQMEKLKMARRSHIDKLVKFIFPISQLMLNPSPLYELQKEKQQSKQASNESLQRETIIEIAEAIRTAHIKGRWKQESFNNGRQYVIVAPSLPRDGNYQEYCDWIVHNKDGSVSSGVAVGSDSINVSQNAAYRIAAGLTYVTQLVQALSFLLDVRLSHKVFYSDFCTMGLNQKQFLKKVARLNLNIISLCYAQNVQMRNIQPSHTIENIFQLLDVKNSDLGRMGPVSDTSDRIIDSIFQSFSELVDDDEDNSGTDEDSEDAMLHKDWENVEILNHPFEVTQSAMVPQTASMAGTIINNVAHSLSFWRGWNK